MYRSFPYIAITNDTIAHELARNPSKRLESAFHFWKIVLWKLRRLEKLPHKKTICIISLISENRLLIKIAYLNTILKKKLCYVKDKIGLNIPNETYKSTLPLFLQVINNWKNK